MKTYAMILQNRVIDVLKDRETEPYYPPDPSGNPVTAIPCDDTVTLGMIYDSETGTFSEYTPPEPEPTPEPQLTETEQAILDTAIKCRLFGLHEGIRDLKGVDSYDIRKIEKADYKGCIRKRGHAE